MVNIFLENEFPIWKSIQVEILGPLDVGPILDLKYLPEEDVLAVVAKLGSISVYNLNSSEVRCSILDFSVPVHDFFFSV